MNKKQTIDFVHLWNKENNLPDGIVIADNMRSEKNGEVFWNISDSPVVDIKKFVRIFEKVTKK